MKPPNTEAAQLLAKRLLDTGTKEMTAHEQRVIERVAKRAAVSRDINAEYDQSSKFGGRLADGVANFGGSWTFLIIFGTLIMAWVGLNTAMLAQAFDPFPYILLNLFLSLLASIQAPVILMSQNRQAARTGWRQPMITR